MNPIRENKPVDAAVLPSTAQKIATLTTLLGNIAEDDVDRYFLSMLHLAKSLGYPLTHSPEVLLAIHNEA
jgi:hypothetical protein